MASDIDAAKAFNRCSEIYAVSYVGSSGHGLIRSLKAGCRSLSGSHDYLKSSASYRRELPRCVDNSRHGVGEYRAKYPVNYNSTYRHLSGIGLAAGLPVD